MKKYKTIKRLLCLIIVLLLSINTLAASSGNNDGSAFITKAEFDSLKNNFQSQIDTYNQNIDNKIDAAIASYLSGISVKKYRDIKLDVIQNLEFPVYSCVGKESSKHTYKENNDPRFDLSLPQVEVQTASILSTNNDAESDDTGLRVFSGHNTGLSYNDAARVIIDLTLNVHHSDPRTGNYEVAVYDTASNKWRTNGYKNGYIKSGTEYKVQDLTISRQKNNLTRQGAYSSIQDNWDTNYRHYLYASFAGSDANNLLNTTNDTTCRKWYGNAAWSCVTANWSSGYNLQITDEQRSFFEDFTGKNLTLDDYKKNYTDAGWVFATGDCRNANVPASNTRVRIETDEKRNKIYSGANAYVNAFPESNIWCYNPVKIGGKWKSDEFNVSVTYNNLMFITNYTVENPGKGLTPYWPHTPILIPALDGDTDDTSYGKDARFSIINADKLYWTDEDGEDHKFNEGLFITKITDDGGLTGKFKFSESSSEKVWCAFSKKPFDGSWTNADALPVTVTVENVKQTISNFQYDCSKEYVFTLDNLNKDDKVYMLFKSSSGSKNPSLDYLNDLQVYVAG